MIEATCEPGGTYLIGSPETVAAGAIAASAVLGGVSRISFQLGISLLPHDTTARAVELLGTRVAPEVRRGAAATRDVV